MIYTAYVGMTRKKSFVSELQKRGIGRVMQRGSVRFNDLYDGEKWFYDNLAYSDWLNGRPFCGDEWLEDLDDIENYEKASPEFCVLPDLVGDPASLDFSMGWRENVSHPFRWYLVLQDGMKEDEVRDCVVDGLFIGGTSRFKLESAKWVAVAKDMSLPIHMGRASTPKKMIAAKRIGCDSMDTSFPLWTQERFDSFLRLHDAGWSDGQLSLLD